MERRGTDIVLSVEDTGIGIPADQIPNLFKPFSQGDGSVTRTFGGTGLGLHLSQKLAHSIDGEIKLKASRPDGGSQFECTFAIGETESASKEEPVVLTSTNEDKSRTDVKLYGRKILIAEDSPDSRDLLQIYFRPTGVQLVFAEDGYQAVEKAWKDRPDLILMDVQMPGLDGLEATRRLRSEGFKNPIIALTAHALQDEVDRSFEAGCSFHLTKPISRATLLTLAAEVLQPVDQNQLQV
jgi:CheY-like chemotaxis protein